MAKAVITGVGVVSAFGIGRERFWDALSEGESAVGSIKHFDASTFPCRYVGEVPHADFGAELLWKYCQSDTEQEQSILNTREQKQLELLRAWESEGRFRDRKVAFGLLAAAEAWSQAQCGEEEEEAELCLALGLECGLLEDFDGILGKDGIHWEKESSQQLPQVRYHSKVDLCAHSILDWLQLKGSTRINVSACAAGGLAVAHAAAMIERGQASIVICGAADSMVNPMGVGGMTRLGAPSPRNAGDACKPFDRKRDGMIIGEGASIFVMEADWRAEKRGVIPLASVLGWGSTQDGYRSTAPRPDGRQAAKAMKRALERANCLPEEIGYINAHGTGTPLNDPAECQAIETALGPYARHIPISSIKGAIGHLMAASGAIEVAASLLPFVRGILPGTAHYQEPDPDCPLHIIGPEGLMAPTFLSGGRGSIHAMTGERSQTTAASLEASELEVIDTSTETQTQDVELQKAGTKVLSNSFGFGGQNVALVLGH